MYWDVDNVLEQHEKRVFKIYLNDIDELYQDKGKAKIFLDAVNRLPSFTGTIEYWANLSSTHLQAIRQKDVIDLADIEDHLDDSGNCKVVVASKTGKNIGRYLGKEDHLIFDQSNFFLVEAISKSGSYYEIYIKEMKK